MSCILESNCYSIHVLYASMYSLALICRLYFLFIFVGSLHAGDSE